MSPRLLGGEEPRRGVIEVVDYCQRQGWEVWVYTTSHRTPFYIRRLFWLHGVINQVRHNRHVKLSCSKHPPSFRIDLLVDDSAGVRLEGERHGFQVVVAEPHDEQWVQQIKAVLPAFAS